MKNKWKKHKPNKLFSESASVLWQMEISEDIYANVYEYPKSIVGKRCYELKIYLPEEKNITGESMNVHIFTYHRKDFDLFEKHARKVIKRLTK